MREDGMKMRWSAWDMKDDPRQKKYEMLKSDDEDSEAHKSPKDKKDPLKMIAGISIR